MKTHLPPDLPQLMVEAERLAIEDHEAYWADFDLIQPPGHPPRFSDHNGAEKDRCIASKARLLADLDRRASSAWAEGLLMELIEEIPSIAHLFYFDSDHWCLLLAHDGGYEGFSFRDIDDVSPMDEPGDIHDTYAFIRGIAAVSDRSEALAACILALIDKPGKTEP